MVVHVRDRRTSSFNNQHHIKVMMRLQILVALTFLFRATTASTNESTVLLGSGKMFDSIAPYYDAANSIMSLGQHHRWRK